MLYLISHASPPKVPALEPRTYLALDAQAGLPNVGQPVVSVRLPGKHQKRPQGRPKEASGVWESVAAFNPSMGI